MGGEQLTLGVMIGASLGSTFKSTLGSATTRLTSLGGEIKRLSNQRGLIERFEKDQAALEKARVSLAATSKQVGRFKLALRKDPEDTGVAKVLESTQLKAQRLSTALEKQKQQLRKSEQALLAAGLSVGNLGGQYDMLGRSLDLTRTKHTRLEQAMSRKSAAAARIGELKGQILGLAGALYSATRMGQNAALFESGLVRLSTVANTANLDKALSVSRKHALEYAKKKMAVGGEVDILTIEYALNSAGIDAQASRVGSEIVSKVATITDGASEGVGEVVATVFNNLGDSLEGNTQEKLTRIGELLTKTQFKFQIRNFDQLGESMRYAAPAMAALNMDLAQGATLIGALNTAGLNGSQAGTSMAATFGKLSKAAEEFGFDIERDNRGGLDFIKTMENLSDAIGGFGEMDQDTVDQIQKVFGDEGQKAVILLGKGLESLSPALKDVSENSKGIIDTNYQRFLSSTAGQFNLLSNNVRIVGMTFMGTLLPTINLAVRPLAELAGLTSILIEDFPWIGKAIGAVAAGLGVYATAVAIGAAKTWLFNAALWANPIGITAGLIVGAAALIVHFWDPISDFFIGLWDDLKASAKTAWSFLGKLFQWTPLGVIMTHWEPIVGFFTGLWDGISSLFQAGVGYLASIWEMSPVGKLLAAGKQLFSWLFGDDEEKTTTLKAVAKADDLAGRRGGAYPRPSRSGRGDGIVETPGAGRAMPSVPPRQVNAMSTVNAAFTINTHPGMDARAVAQEVDRRLREREHAAAARARGVLHD